MTAKELRQKYLDFFREKGHAIIPSASVVPENDPTVLFTTAGMHPLVPYLVGEKHPGGKRLANAQKCIRTGDIDDVGDNRHLTFFEMLGNWSLGDYFKREAIEWSWEFLTDPKWLGLDPERIYVTVFAGDANSEKDEKSIEIWKEQYQKAGISAKVCPEGGTAVKDHRIFLLGPGDNWWGPAGETGPCGPCTEMFYDTRPEEGDLRGTHDDLVASFRLMEIWNDVFMEFNKRPDGTFEKMAQQNVDTGMGLERTIAVLTGKSNVFETDLFTSIIQKIEELSGKKYSVGHWKKPMRIVADHIKAAVFIISDGVVPGNTGRGYVLRRLVRRAVRQGYILGIEKDFTVAVAEAVREMYGEAYPEIKSGKVAEVLREEEEKFGKTLRNGLAKFNGFLEKQGREFFDWPKEGGGGIVKKAKYEELVKVVFDLYQSAGFPIELTLEEFRNRDIHFDESNLGDLFLQELEKHQNLSRTASAGMFKGGLADNREETTRLHTAAHLMLAGLRKVLGEHVHQKGSNINGERLRFDFSHPEKMTQEQKKAVEDFVNEAISSKIPVEMKEMTISEARESGAEGAFENKYGETVKVYSISGYSKEICGGPHVKNTAEIGGAFKIQKEESSSSGVRRIKAVIEKK